MVHVPSPVHCTIDVPGDLAMFGWFLQAFLATHPISQRWMASHSTPSAHAFFPLSSATPHRPVQVFALQVVGAFAHVPSPRQPIAHEPASQVTPLLHEL